MAIVYKGQLYRVDMIESERGWGQRVDDSIYFDNEAEAIQYVKDYNEKYNPPQETVPDWYMIAEYVGRF